MTAGLIPGSAELGRVPSPFPVIIFRRPRLDLFSNNISAKAAADGTSRPCKSTTKTPLSLRIFSSTDQDLEAQTYVLSSIGVSIALTLITSASLIDFISLPDFDCSLNLWSANVVTITEAASPETAPERAALGTSGLSRPLRKKTIN